MAESGWTTLRPWHVSAALFVLFGGAGLGFGLAGLGPAMQEPSFAELGWWAFALGAGQFFVVLAGLALLHRGPGIMYCEAGLPGISTWSAGGVCTISLLIVAFAGVSLGGSLGASYGKQGAVQGGELVTIALWAGGGWLATVAFVPLRRRIRRLREQRSSG